MATDDYDVDINETVNIQYKPFKGYDVSYLSQAFYSWATELIMYGYKQTIKVHDLFDLPSYMKANNYAEHLEQTYEYYKYKKFSYLRALVYQLRYDFILPMAMFRTLLLVLSLARPIILRYMLLTVTLLADNNTSDDKYNSLLVTGFLYAALLSVITMSYAIMNHYYFYIGIQSALTARGATVSVLYRKSLRVDILARNQLNIPLTNLASVDADQFMNWLWGQALECM